MNPYHQKLRDIDKLHANIIHVMPLKKNDWYVKEQKPAEYDQELTLDRQESEEWNGIQKPAAQTGVGNDFPLGSKVEIVKEPAVKQGSNSNNNTNDN